MLDFSGLKGSTGGLAKLGGGGSGSVGIPGARDAGGVGLRPRPRGAGHRRQLPGGRHREGRPQARRHGAGGDGTGQGGGDGDARRWQREPPLAGEPGPGAGGREDQPWNAAMVTVCDREGDIWDMFEAQAEGPRRGRAAGAFQRLDPPLRHRRR